MSKPSMSKVAEAGAEVLRFKAYIRMSLAEFDCCNILADFDDDVQESRRQ